MGLSEIFRRVALGIPQEDESRSNLAESGSDDQREDNSESSGTNRNLSQDKDRTLDSLEPSELEKLFQELAHEERLAIVKHTGLSWDTWRRVSNLIRREPLLTKRWGLDGKLLKFLEQGKQCIAHGTIAEKRELQRSISHTAQSARQESTKFFDETGVDVRIAHIKAGSSDKESESHKESEEDMTKESLTVWECATGRKDCRVNRRIFIRAGDFYMTGGATKQEHLDKYLAEAAEECGVEIDRKHSELDK